MPINVGTQLGSYQITGLLGAGGMGEVYRARDSRLNRDVAIKTLPDGFANDTGRLSRFEREAQAVASLSHPNIATIHELEMSGSSPFIVMELVEGETLADRLKRGPLDLDDALAVARQIAAALEAAHDKGIVHRDLKPANIKIAPDGKVKVLDFGLAKVIDKPISTADAGSERLSQSPTFVSGGTIPGVILGTAEYMSPEQAHGKTVDRRTDVWAFGCVLYEMLTARRAFTGDDVMQTIAAILRGEPDWHAVPAYASGLSAILHRCLQRDPDRRLRDVRDVRIALEDIGVFPSAPTGSPNSVSKLKSSSNRWLVAALSIMGAALVALIVRDIIRISPAAKPIHLSLLPPDEEHFTDSPLPGVAISPNGQFVAFVSKAAGAAEQTRLWIRSMERPDASLVEGSEGALAPFWSPDNRSVAFFADRKLKRTSLEGGNVRVIADVPLAGGGRQSGTWNSDNIILMGMDHGKPLYVVPADGGIPKSQTTLNESRGELSHFRPSFLPDGKHFLFLAAVSPTDPRNGIYVGSLDSNDVKLVIGGISTTAVFVSPAHLLYGRQGALWAQQFNLSSFETVGEPIRILDSIEIGGGGSAGAAGFSASDNGRLIYRTASLGVEGQPRQLTWFDRSGKQLKNVGEPGLYGHPKLSPDGRQVVVDSRTGVWLLDSVTGAASKLTSFGGMPLWSFDGKSMIFNGGEGVHRKASNGEGNEEVVLKRPAFIHLDDWSVDGKRLLVSRNNALTNRDVVMVAIDGEPQETPIAATVANELQGQLSSDGKWIAFVSDETGRPEIYVQTFPVAGNRHLVSTEGGVQPRWRRDGKELFFVAADATLTAVPVTGTNPLTFGKPLALFKTPAFRATAATIGSRAEYDISPDGQRILINVALADPVPSPIHVLLNWESLLRK